MAGTATCLSFPETLRTLKRFHDECGLAKPAVFVKTFTGEISKRNPGALAEEILGGQIIQFTGGAVCADGGLHVALRTNAYEITGANITETHWRITRLLSLVIPDRHVHDVLQRGAMAHFTIDTRLLKL